MKKIVKVFGSPGTGKTTYLLNLMEKLLKTYSPEEIAFVSFTKKGSYEGRDRALEKFGFSEEQTPYFRTLHSLAFRELNLNRGSIMDKSDFKELSRILGMNFLGFYTEDLQHNDDAYLFFDQLIRNNNKTAKNMLDFIEISKLKFVKFNYVEYKRKFKLLDFTDMIELFIAEKKEIPVKIAIIDEAQDLTTLQWKMIFTAFRNVDVCFIAGDDDQAIYQWSGADYDLFLNIKADETIILDKSYRLPDNILNFSTNLIKRINNRIEKKVVGKGINGGIYKINRLEDVIINSEEDFLFLSRNNFFLSKIKKHFEEKGFIYNYKGESSFKETDFDNIVEYCKLKNNPAHKINMSSSLKLNLLPETNFSLDWFDCFNWDEKKIAYYRDMIKNKIHLKKNKNINININTIHTVKGGEADNVIVMDDITNNVYKNLQTNPDAENRIFYVAVTRAKKNLYLLQGDSRYSFNF